MSARVGGTAVLMDAWNAERALEIMEHERVTGMWAAPTFLETRSRRLLPQDFEWAVLASTHASMFAARVSASAQPAATPMTSR